MNPAYKKAVLILARAFCLVSDRWTNRGYKIRQDNGTYKVDVIGAIALAKEQLYGKQHVSAEADTAIKLINDAAHKHFSRSAVSVNDELGYIATVKLYALAIERGISYGLGVDPDTGRLEHQTDRGKA